METKSIDFASIPQTAVKVVTSPTDFFRQMPKTGGFLEPLVFLVVMGAVSGVLGGLFMALSGVLGLHLYPGQMGIFAIVMMPIMYAVGSAIFGFVTAAVLFVIWKLMGSNESYETAYRCIAYLSALSPITTVLGVIPYLGGAVGLLIATYYLVTASVQVHGIPAQKAWLVFGILAAIFIVLSVSAQITARRFARNMEQATESWKGAADEMQKSAEQMQQRMEDEMEKHKQSLSQPAEQAQESAEDMQQSAQDMQRAAEQLQKQMQEQLKKQNQ
jgi:hypothetical protein